MAVVAVQHQTAASCYLSPSEEHHQLLDQLNGSVVLQPTQDNVPGLSDLQNTLSSRYGGGSSDWHTLKVANAYLVSLPPWVSQEQVYEDEAFWDASNVAVHPWQTLTGASSAPQSHRVMITISDFPSDYWHPKYFLQATASFGEMMGMAADTMTSGNRAVLSLVIQCINGSIIPPL